MSGVIRFGINPDGRLGLSVAAMRRIAKTLGHDRDWPMLKLVESAVNWRDTMPETVLYFASRSTSGQGVFSQATTSSRSKWADWGKACAQLLLKSST